MLPCSAPFGQSPLRQVSGVPHLASSGFIRRRHRRGSKAMAQATGSFKGALWLTAAVMLVGMALLLALPKET